jgi:hypothetical protein
MAADQIFMFLGHRFTAGVWDQDLGIFGGAQIVPAFDRLTLSHPARVTEPAMALRVRRQAETQMVGMRGQTRKNKASSVPDSGEVEGLEGKGAERVSPGSGPVRRTGAGDVKPFSPCSQCRRATTTIGFVLIVESILKP